MCRTKRDEVGWKIGSPAAARDQVVNVQRLARSRSLATFRALRSVASKDDPTRGLPGSFVLRGSRLTVLALYHAQF